MGNRSKTIICCVLWMSAHVALGQSAAAGREPEFGASLAGLPDYAREHNPEFAAMRRNIGLVAHHPLINTF